MIEDYNAREGMRKMCICAHERRRALISSLYKRAGETELHLFSLSL